MSEEKPQVEDSAPEAETPAPATKPASPITPAIGLLFLIVFLLGILVLMNFRNRGIAVSKDDPAVAALRADLDARRSDLNRQRISLGLPPLEGGSEPVEDIASRLKKDTDTLVALASRFQEMLAEKDLEVSGKNTELIHSEKIRQSLTATNRSLQEEVQRALVAGDDAERLRREVADQAARRDAMAAELSKLREQLATAANSRPSEDFELLERRLEEATSAKEFFEKRVKELETELARLRIFAKSEDELMPAAVQLFRSLRELEGRPDSDLTTAYSGFGVSLGANVLHTLNFPTGSSELSEQDLETIRNLADEIPDGDLLLVVGYASKTGDEENNRKLSSSRATTAAQTFSGIKRPEQLVQAVYLGQTDRFSSRIPERNQICEIWRIRKKP